MPDSRQKIQAVARRQFVWSLIFATTISLGMCLYGLLRSHTLAFDYLPWNLFLATIPLIIAVRLVKVLKTKHWSDWEPIGWTLVWLLFLPNSFYMISDYIHLREVDKDHVLYASVLFTSFICLAVIMGFCSLYLVHQELRRRLSGFVAGLWVAGVLLICSAAIYIGRDLRWNSWDVLVNPAGLLFDISDRFLRPDAYPEMFVTMLSFFAVLAGLYAVMWSGAKLLRAMSATDS